MPTYEELLAQISALKKQVNQLGKENEKAQSKIKNLTLQKKNSTQTILGFYNSLN